MHLALAQSSNPRRARRRAGARRAVKAGPGHRRSAGVPLGGERRSSRLWRVAHPFGVMLTVCMRGRLVRHRARSRRSFLMPRSQREVLPIPDRPFTGLVTFDAKDPERGQAIETPEFMASRIELFGTPDALNHFAVGWAHAMDTPYQWVKQIGSHGGGTRQCTLVPGRTASASAERPASISAISSTSRRRCSTRPGFPSRRSSTASSKCRCTARAWSRRSTRPTCPSSARRSTSR